MKLSIKKEYLPSNQFIARILIIAVLIAAIFGVYQLGKFIVNKIRNRSAGKVLVGELVGKDTNKNGIADWEESLWGLDPTKDGDENKVFIAEKKKALANGQENTDTPLSENEKIARDFFAIVTSLSQSGNLNEETIRELADAIGTQAVAAPIPDIYAKENIQTVSTTPASIKAYHAAFLKLAEKYSDKDIGNELVFISQGLDNNDANAIYAAVTVAQEYKAFGKELTAIKTPTSLLNTATELANNYEKTGRSIEELGKLTNDPLAGMRGLVNYKRYNDGLLENLETMKTFFNRNGILR